MQGKIIRTIWITACMLLFAIAAGFLFINTQIGRSYIVRNNATRVSKALTAAEAQKNQKTSTSYDASKTRSVSAEQLLRASKYEAYPIGRMSIPVVNTHNPVFNGFGTQNQNLSFGVCTVIPDRKLGGDNNYVLAGHYMGNYGPAVLDNIHLLHNGDHIYVTDLQKIYDYKVTKLYLALKPTQVSVENNVGKQRMITLITCSDFNQAKYGFGKHRTVVQGRLQRTYPATENNLIRYELSSEIVKKTTQRRTSTTKLNNITFSEICAAFAIVWVLIWAWLLIRVWKR